MNFPLFARYFNRDVRSVYRSLRAAKRFDPQTHLQLAFDWISAAQDSSADSGVARSYHLTYDKFFGFVGWCPSYPETSGYIIPSLYNFSRLSQDLQWAERARRIADWQIDIQLDSGAVMSGYVGQNDNVVLPAVFNTGQVIFGWLRAAQETGDERFLDAARRAGEFLLSNQSPKTGTWEKGLSPYLTKSHSHRTYNVRTAWALHALGKQLDRNDFVDGALTNANFIVSSQAENGWLDSNCLLDANIPLLHTIAYSARGLLEIGLAEQDSLIIDASRKIADGVIASLGEDGFLAGRFDRDWQPAVDWTCPTASAQLGIVLGKLGHSQNEPDYLLQMRGILNSLLPLQISDTGKSYLDGGLFGSVPIENRYGRYQLLNWAAKFFADLIMLDSVLAGDTDVISVVDIC